MTLFGVRDFTLSSFPNQCTDFGNCSIIWIRIQCYLLCCKKKKSKSETVSMRLTLGGRVTHNAENVHTVSSDPNEKSSHFKPLACFHSFLKAVGFIPENVLAETKLMVISLWMTFKATKAKNMLSTKGSHSLNLIRYV